MRERRLGEDVVGEPVRELRERVRRAGRDDEQVGARRGAGRDPRPAGRRASAAKVSARDEALGAGRDERDDLVAVLDEQPHELARLVGGDAAGDAEEDSRHGRIVPVRARRVHALAARLALVLVLDLALGDLLEGHGQVVLRARLDQRRRGLVEAVPSPSWWW